MKNTLSKACKKTVAFCLVIAIVFGMLYTGNLTTYAYEAQSGMIFTTDRSLLETKQEPSTDAAKANGLLYGKPVIVTDEVTDKQGQLWYKLSYKASGKDATGYCLAENVLLDKDAYLYGTAATVTDDVVLMDFVASYTTTELAVLPENHRLELLDSREDVNGMLCYRVRCDVDGKELIGWIEGQFISIDAVPDIPTDAAYEEQLEELGFPESYIKLLAVLHEQYPNWVFEPVHTNLDWNTVVAEESKPGRNLIHKNTNDARKSLAESEYNWYTNTWTIRDSSGWVTAHPDYIAYCLDPRNFLNPTNIFMFESLSYSSAQNLTGIHAILEGSFMENDVTDTDGSVINYAKAFMNIGKEKGVSPYHLASRVLQEQGRAGASPLISGTYEGYEGYFNYFNVGSHGTPNSTLYSRGLSYAKNAGWSTRYASLLGGAQMLAKNYIDAGQDTLYFQKFDVIEQGGLYVHQYMTNVDGAISEGKTVAGAYTDKSQAFVFKIPIYDNMPEAPVQFTGSGNPNNYLAGLNVEGFSLTPTFDAEVTEYTMIVGDSIRSVTVSASAVALTSKVTGTGTYDLSVGTNTIKINCTSQSGDTKTYTLTIVRQKAEGFENLVASNQYLIGEYVTGIGAGTTAADLAAGFTGDDVTVKVFDAAGAEYTGMAATGNQIAVYYADGSLAAKKDIIIYGDVSGDGNVNILDLIKLNRHILNISTLNGSYEKAADVNRDGSVNILDIITLNRSTLGLIEIKQN